ncbi:uncharacterized protein LOC125037184 [Penaeus chinensis]|uniref:uncharacterized protein LOC125037184 n=1 Tax=Penaeus chinensis TaxID=139456 RepID=UPI001FB7C0E3|nr:uncharacterized protein LOC125037184 [Penaeus chinensis]
MWMVLLFALPLALDSFQATRSADAREQETVNAEEQRYKYLMYQIHGMVQKLLYEKERHFSERLEALTQLVETSCRSQPGKQTTGPIGLANMERTAEEITNIFFERLTAMRINEDIKAKLTAMATDIMREITAQLLGMASVQDLAALQSQVSTLATSEALSGLQKDLSPFASSATEDIKQAVSRLASEVDTSMKNIATSNQIAEIQEELDSVPFCNLRNDFDRVLTFLSTNKEDIGDLDEALRASLAEQKAACQGGAERQESAAGLVQLMESLRTAVDGNANSIRSVASAVGKLEGEVAARLGALEELARKINNNTLPPPTTTTTTTTPGPTTTTTPAIPVFPCLDSNFASAGSGVDVCRAAVRLGKCQRLSVAIHCCRSCSDAGEIPVMGAHRFVNSSRTLSRVSAAKLMRP